MRGNSLDAWRWWVAKRLVCLVVKRRNGGIAPPLSHTLSASRILGAFHSPGRAIARRPDGGDGMRSSGSRRGALGRHAQEDQVETRPSRLTEAVPVFGDIGNGLTTPARRGLKPNDRRDARRRRSLPCVLPNAAPKARVPPSIPTRAGSPHTGEAAEPWATRRSNRNLVHGRRPHAPHRPGSIGSGRECTAR